MYWMIVISICLVNKKDINLECIFLSQDNAMVRDEAAETGGEKKATIWKQEKKSIEKMGGKSNIAKEIRWVRKEAISALQW